MSDYKITYYNESEWCYIGYALTEKEARTVASELEQRANAEGGTVAVYDPTGRAIHSFTAPGRDASD